MGDFSIHWPMVAIISLSALSFYLFTVLSHNRMTKALRNYTHPKTKKVKRLYVFEAMAVFSKIDEDKADIALNAVIRRYGMGGVKWGHLQWVYEQVSSSLAVQLSSMPNKTGV